MKNLKNKIIVSLLGVYVPASILLADGDFNPLKVTSMKALIGEILSGLTYILTPVIVLALIYSGFLFVSAQGNSEKIKTAKTAFTYTVIGAALILGANLIFTVVTATIEGVIVPPVT